MIINLNKIPTSGLEIHEKVVLNKDLYENANVLEIKNLHIQGKINYDYENNLVLTLDAEGSFLLEDAITLEAIDYPFSCEIEEKIENIEETCGNFYEKSKNTLDISEILWENIVLEIPISATTANVEDLELRGSGWELAKNEEDKMDPRLEKLRELLDEGKE